MRLPRWLFVTLNIYALILAAIMLWPFLQMVLTSFTSDVIFPPRYFSVTAWNNVLWPDYFKTMLVSLRMGFWAAVLLIAICLPAAYAIERRRFPGRSALGSRRSNICNCAPMLSPSGRAGDPVRANSSR